MLLLSTKILNSVGNKWASGITTMRVCVRVCVRVRACVCVCVCDSEILSKATDFITVTYKNKIIRVWVLHKPK
jgi:hypothetical protein